MNKSFFLLFITCKIYSQDSILFPLYFEKSHFNLDTAEYKSLILFIDQFKNFQIQRIEINGFCDDRGSDILNLRLSLERAKNVERILRQKLDTNTSFYIYARGELPIRESRDVESQRDSNRRVSISIYYQKYKSKKTPSSELENFLTNAKKGNRMDLSIYFIPGRHVVIKNSEAKLDTLYQFMHSNNRKILIEGHVSGEVWEDDGWDEDTKEKKLSVNRAKYVYDYLIKKGIEKSRLRYVGMKSRIPSPKGAIFDRRIEIVLED